MAAPTARLPQAPGNLSCLVLERCHLPGRLGVAAAVTAAKDGPARGASRGVGRGPGCSGRAARAVPTSRPAPWR
eukprot:4454527-Alexandrium_andersonii.AAC.1